MTVSINDINNIMLRIYAHDYKPYMPVFHVLFLNMPEHCEICGLEEGNPVHHQTSTEGTDKGAANQQPKKESHHD